MHSKWLLKIGQAGKAKDVGLCERRAIKAEIVVTADSDAHTNSLGWNTKKASVAGVQQAAGEEVEVVSSYTTWTSIVGIWAW